MKTAEELNAIKEEVKTLNNKLAELTDEELKQVFGGSETFVTEKGESKKEFSIYKNEIEYFEPKFQK